MNRTLTDFVLRCHRLEPRLDVDGILGMDILSQGELKLNLPQGQVEFTWA